MNTTISHKRNAQGAGHQSTKDDKGSEGDTGGDYGGKGKDGGICIWVIEQRFVIHLIL